MRTIGDKSQQPVVLDKNRGDDRDIRQVRSAVKRIIQDRHVTRLKGQVPAAGFDGERHRPEMDRDMGSLRHQVPRFVEHGAGKVTALLDVWRKRRSLQAPPISSATELNKCLKTSRSTAFCTSVSYSDQHVLPCIDLRVIGFRQQNGGIVLEDDGRPGHVMPRS